MSLARPAAALDVGTNTILLLIGRRAAASASGGDGGLEIELDRCATPRLGQGVAAHGRLDGAAVERALAVLRDFAGELAARAIPAARVRAVGTAVFRRASDGPEFAARVARELGLTIAIASEAEEARLAYAAAVGGTGGEGAARDTRVIDVGGGSTELIADGGRARCSAPVGAVVLSETYLGERALRPGGFEALCAAARAALAALPLPEPVRDGPVIALGGTAVNLACLSAGLAAFDPERAEGVRIRAQEARNWARRLADLPHEARCAFPIEPERAAILPAGLVCLAEALERLGSTSALASGRGLRYGVLRELLSDLEAARG